MNPNAELVVQAPKQKINLGIDKNQVIKHAQCFGYTADKSSESYIQ